MARWRGACGRYKEKAAEKFLIEWFIPDEAATEALKRLNPRARASTTLGVA